MKDIRLIIREAIALAENIQQADKIYFNTGRLSPEAKKYILHITGGDVWTKLICDIYYAIVTQSKKNAVWMLSGIGGDSEEKQEISPDGQEDVLGIEDWKKVRQYHNQLKAYNKNVFPIEGFNINGVQDIWAFIRSLNEREKIVEDIKKLPSIAIRNMKDDFRQIRNSSDLQAYRDRLEHFLVYYSMLDNREEKMKATIQKKMFIAGVTLNDLLNFVEEKQNLLGGVKFTKNSVKKIIDNNYHNELEVIYEKGNVMVVEVSGPHGIKDIGCNSVWCFTYGSGFDNAWRQWDKYSTNGIVYAIIDFSEPSDSPEFMHVLIKPINYNPESEDEDDEDNNSVLYNMANEESYGAINVIDQLIGIDNAKKLLTFGEEPEEEEIIEPDENAPEPEYQDPNQLKLDLQEISKLVREYFNNLKEV